MSGDSGLEDLSLMDLFRSEVETHSEVLSSALLALERAPGDTSRYAEMMRAAHSIKGAARVVGVDPAVDVAHAMEDCFVAAQKGTLQLAPADVDVLLAGVDLLARISEATRESGADLAQRFSEPVVASVSALEALLAPRPAAAEPAAKPATTTPTPTPTPTPAPTPTPTSTPAAAIVAPELLDASAAEAIRRRYLAAVEEGQDPVVLDLGATRDLDATGLALLAAIPPFAARHGGRAVRIGAITPELALVFDLTGLAALYELPAAVRPEGA